MSAWQLSYYNAKVAKAIDGWPAGVRADFRNIAVLMVAHGPNIGMPHTRAMGGGLFEVRAKGREGIGRALFCTVIERRIVILHGFIKKTEQTPAHDLEIARERLKEVKS
jgi:phage-related protein